MNDLVVVGCGGFGREVFDIVASLNQVTPTWNLLGFVDDAPSAENRALVERMGSRVLGGGEWLDGHERVHVAVAIGSNEVRRTLDARWRDAHEMAVLVHPRAYVGSLAELGPGTIIAAGAHLTTSVRTGRLVHVDALASVAHDCVLGDYSRVNPHGCLSGGVQLGEGTLVGANATVLQYLRVGDGTTVGAGACVVKDVEPGVVVKGVPAR